MRARKAPASKQRRKKVLAAASGFWGRRSKHLRRAKESVRKALSYAYRDRRNKKREFRSLWITRITAAVRARGMAYRTFIAGLNKKKAIFSRDILAQIAAEEPKVFDEIVEFSKS